MQHTPSPRLEPQTTPGTGFQLFQPGSTVPGDPRLLELELFDSEGSSGPMLLAEEELDELVLLLKDLIA